MKVLPAKSKEFKKSSKAIAASNLSSSSVDDYESLKLKLFIITLALAGFIFLAVVGFYGLGVALNYLLGACTGVVYLKMLAKSVDELGKTRKRLGYSRFGVFIAVFILAARLHQLQILPIFLGFITYKAAVLVILTQDLLPMPKSDTNQK
ncbi:ATP synthase I subunit [Synechococcus sp. PCC 7502]|uniref:ATP synthase I subunit n=1 Tax=Synechococcus sp. PCC 7502 TaxID=1173263 RepID=UPI000303C109|nr:ATP synthase I subunit [Synechococcus sp. PCC 7502]